MNRKPWRTYDPNGFLTTERFRTRNEARKYLAALKSAYPKTLRKARVTR